MSDKQHEREPWHISRTINLGHIVTTAFMVVAAFWFFAQQDSRISQAELNIRHLQESRVQDEARTEKKFDELKQDLRIINAKLDTLIRKRDGS